MSSSTKYLVLLITIPTVVVPGTFTGRLAAARPSALYYSDPILFNVTVGPAMPLIVMASPSQAQSSGGEAVILFVFGFPQPMASAAISITFGAVTAQLLGDPLPDGQGGTSLSLTAPSGSGMAVIQIIYTIGAAGNGTNFSSTLGASIPFLYVSNNINFVCFDG